MLNDALYVCLLKITNSIKMKAEIIKHFRLNLRGATTLDMTTAQHKDTQLNVIMSPNIFYFYFLNASLMSDVILSVVMLNVVAPNLLTLLIS